jgi:FKBP-type peptidyl-prolyl cis-trans isomerase
MTLRALAFAAAALILTACAHAPAPVAGVAVSTLPYAQAQAQWEAGQKAYEVWSRKRPGWTTTASGLQYRRIGRAQPKAPNPEPGATVTIHYTGTFIDGRPFDSSRERGEPATFPLGRLIKGWQEGVPQMRVGEHFAFVIPSDLAYGSRYRDPIPSNSTLLFDIELIAIPADAP